MLVVTGLVTVDPADAAAFRAAAAVMSTETRQEVGCRTYAFYEDVERPGVFRVYEEWDNQTTLTDHGNAPHMAEFRAKLSKLNILSRDIQKFDGGPKMDL